MRELIRAGAMALALALWSGAVRAEGVQLKVSMPDGCAAGWRSGGGLAVVCLSEGDVLVRARHAGAAGTLTLQLDGTRTRLVPGETVVLMRRPGPVLGVLAATLAASDGAAAGDLVLDVEGR